MDFLFAELHILFSLSDSAPVNCMMLNKATQWVATLLLVLNKTNKEEERPVVWEAGNKQDFGCKVMLGAKLERVRIKKVFLIGPEVGQCLTATQSGQNLAQFL